MKGLNFSKHIAAYIFLCSVLGACSNGIHISEGWQNRLKTYLHADNTWVDVIFSENDMAKGVQPALTQVEFNILDVLATRIDDEVCLEFDRKCAAWMSCWAHIDPEELLDNPHQALKCNEAEYQELLSFCKQQDENVILLFYQLIARANCPYDQFLLRPILDLSERFPEYRQYWEGINQALMREKPELENRKCNEATIWYTRKMLEDKYGYTYASRLSSLFDTRKLLLMTQ
ncbi:MAG: hypothetical protein LBR08_04740 [Bacteroidales bacterium]|jgi:hypothetical protein|nr:hypothetical protein [Bacteroidales bacterium]